MEILCLASNARLLQDSGRDYGNGDVIFKSYNEYVTKNERPLHVNNNDIIDLCITICDII